MWQEEYDDAECAEWAQSQVARLVCAAGAAALREGGAGTDGLFERIEHYMEKIK